MAKRIKKYTEVVPTSDEEKLDALKVGWQKFEDENPADFEHFYAKLLNYFNYENRDRYYPKVGDLEYDLECRNSPNQSSRSYSSQTDVWTKSPEWRKRNGYILYKVNTSGYSGGNCWGDDAEYYETYESLEFSEFEKILENLFLFIFGENHPFANIPELLDKLRAEPWKWKIQEDSDTNYEYYGNSDNYSFYKWTFWDMYYFLSKNEAF